MKEKEIFDGKKQHYGNLAKLIEKDINSTMTMEVLEICTAWNTTSADIADERIPTTEDIINILMLYHTLIN